MSLYNTYWRPQCPLLSERPPTAVRGKAPFMAGFGFGENALLPSDSLGSCSITLRNIIVGSRYWIGYAAGGSTVVATGVASSTTEVVSVPYYAAGNANNDLRVEVRKASAAPKYQPFESFVTAAAGGGSVYVAQVPDTIA